MRQLSNGQCNDAVLRSLFIEQLPESYKPILVTINEPDLQRLAETADKIADSFATSNNSSATLAAVKHDGRDDASSIENKFTDITNRLKKLETSIKKLSQNRGRSHLRKRSNTRSNDSTETVKPSGLCYPHYKYGAKANNCRAPCSWVSAKTEN